MIKLWSKRVCNCSEKELKENPKDESKTHDKKVHFNVDVSRQLNIVIDICLPHETTPAQLIPYALFHLYLDRLGPELSIICC